MGRLSRIFLGIVLVISPLLLGSNRAVFWALNGVLASIAVLFFVLAEWKSIKRSSSDWLLPSRLLALLLLPVVWMLFQLLPNMPVFLAHPTWQFVTNGADSVSLSPQKTALALLWWLTMAITFVAVRAGTRRGGSRFFLQLMLSVIFSVALFGLANGYFGWHSVGIIPKYTYEDWLTGTFVNRNTAASFFVIGIAIATVLTSEIYQELNKKFFGASFVAQVFIVLSSRISLPIFGGIVIFIAALLTGSRAGLASLVLAETLVFILIWKDGKNPKQRWPILLIVGLAMASIAANALLERREGASSSWARVELAKEALSAISARPILGHGAGTYQDVEPLYHVVGNSSQYIWSHAHNSYLEAATDLGLPMTGLWLGLMAALLFQLWRLQRKSSKLMMSTVVLLAVTVSEGLHALVDFSLQTQAIAIYIACLLGLAVGEAITHQSTEITYPKNKSPA